MSFRELRNFTEIMRALGYPRLVSVENFRAPNFELVADALYWMVKRYDPDINISDNIESEDDRVDFLTGAATAMLNKAHIKLNAKKLYTADGHAVKELLKLASVLYRASRAEEELGIGEVDQGEDGAELSLLTSQRVNVKEVRALATEITEKGARLYDLLGKEKEARSERMRAMAFLEVVSGNLGSTSESELIESGGREILARTRESITSLRRQCEDLEADEAALEGEIRKKQADLERGEKRLKSLQAHRPAFAEELEKLEGELRRFYEVYMDRFRNLDYLEHELEQYHKLEQEELEEYERKRNRNAERIRREQLKQFIGREPTNESAIEEELLRNKYPSFNQSTKGSSRGGSRGGGGSGSTHGSGKQPSNGGGGRSSARGGGRVGASSARGSSGKGESLGDARKDHGNSSGGASSSGDSGSDLNQSDATSEDEEVFLIDSDEESGSLIDEDDESSEGESSHGSSRTDDENF